MKTQHKESAEAPALGSRQKLITYVTAVTLITAMTGLVLFQGGFHATVSAVAGVLVALACLAFAVIQRHRHVSLRSGDKTRMAQIALFAVVVLLYLISTLCQSFTATSIAKCVPWVVGLGCLCVTLFATAEARRLTFTWLGIVGICLAYIGLLMFSKALVVSGSLNAERLQFTFQYANAAGIFFLAAAVLCLSSAHPVIRAGWVIPMLALCETQSVAAIALSVVCVAAFCAFYAKQRAFIRSNATCIGLVAALVLFLCCKLLPTGLGLIGVLLATVVWVGMIGLEKSIDDFDKNSKQADSRDTRARKESKRSNGNTKKGTKQKSTSKQQTSLYQALANPRLLICCGVLVAVAVAAFTGLNSDRIAQAGQTIVERAIQVCDAVALVAASPLLGVGPGNWQFCYADVQSAQYATTVVHSSFAKIAVDAGLIALVAFVAFCACGLKMRVEAIGLEGENPANQYRELGVLLASLALLVHMVIDFDLEYSSLLVLLVFLLSPWGCDRNAKGDGEEAKASLALPLCLAVIGVLCGVVSVAVLVNQAAVDRLEQYSASGDANGAQAIVSENPLIANDLACQTSLLTALANSGQYGQVIDLCANRKTLIADQEFELAQAYYKTGRISEAEDVLASLCMKHPYQVSVFEKARQIAAVCDESFLTSERFLAAVSRANDLAHEGKAAWLNNQKDVGAAN